MSPLGAQRSFSLGEQSRIGAAGYTRIGIST